ncbi:MAG: PQQ-binding-like beta-propeller repeat protein [Pirellulaceae bacterium]
MKRFLLHTLEICLLLGFASPGLADEAALVNWPQFRGPLASGVAPQGNPPTEWNETKNIRWKVAIPGIGSSTPVVWNDKVFLLTAIETDRKDDSVAEPADQPKRQFGIVFPNKFHQFVVLCLDRATGKTLWQKIAAELVPHEGHHPDNDFASATPVTDGKHVWASFGSRGVYCYDFAGDLKWKKDFGNLRTKLSFGEGSSPALFDNTLVTTWDHEDRSFIVAQNALTGEVRWKKDRDEQSAWATPLIVERAGRTQVITNASTKVRSYDLATGEVLWECGGQVGNVTPAPVASDKLVFCMSGYRGSALLALPLDQTGDLTDSDKIAWKADRGTPYIPSPLLYDNRLYFTQSNDGLLTCLDAATGKVLIDRTRLPEVRRIYASPVGAAGRVYLTSRDGVTLVIRHADTFEVLATNKLDEPIDASAAIAGDELFLRGSKHLYCIAE